MNKKLINITGFTGTDTTTDPYLLGKTDPRRSSMSYNFRAKNGVRVARNGYQTVVSGSVFNKSGVYFPVGGKAIVPIVSTDIEDTFYCAGSGNKAFSIEFWYKASYKGYDRYICHAPVTFTVGSDTVEKHMTIVLYAPPNVGPKTYLRLYFGVDATTDLRQLQYLSTSAISADNEWHHIAITRDSSGNTPKLYVDGASGVTMTVETGHAGDLLTQTNFYNDQEAPLYYNHFEIGDDEIYISDFRIWDDERSEAEIVANKDISLAGNEANLVCYVPFDEADGRYFEEKVTSARGYLVPQEPYVNDDNELVFTGYECYAYPSLRPSFKYDEDTYTLSPTHTYQNEDGEYDGGILWDTKLYHAGTPDRTQEGVYWGTAQLRFKLRQLKEGVLCGRLGLFFDNSSGVEKYGIYFVHEDDSAVTYTYEDWIDESWIGVEHTITARYYGSYPNHGRVSIYIDDTQVNVINDEYGAWSNGSYIYDSSYLPYVSTGGENDTSGAIGGSTEITQMCIAFDLIFFRQWWDEVPDANPTNYVSDTYDLDILPDEYRYFLKDLSGYIKDGSEYAYIEGTSPVNTGDGYLLYLRMPIHVGSDTNAMITSGDTALQIDDGGTDYLIKHDILIKRMVADWSGANFKLLPTGKYFELNVNFEWDTTLSANIRRFSGACLSALVNEYNYKTFQDNQTERPVIYDVKRESVLTNAWEEERTPRIFNTITDDTPLQGVDRIGGVNYASKFLILGCKTNRNYSIHKQISHKPRWCTGPISYLDVDTPPVRCITRFTSEDRKVDKLLAVVGCSVWTLDTDGGTAEENAWGWIEKNGDTIINASILNNRLILMDDNQAIKLNFKDHFSRLGIERPVTLQFSTSHADDNAIFLKGERYAYVAQFRDSENNVFSGTLPVYTDHNQSIKIDGDTSTEGVDYLKLWFFSCLDPNVDEFLVYRTTNLEDQGVAALLYLVRWSKNSRVELDTEITDVWQDAELDDQSIFSPLDINYFGVDMSPFPSVASASAYNRFFTFGNTKEETTLRWSGVDILGFGKPDEFHPLDALIVEEGGTTGGTALIEYNNVLFAFKENAIFSVTQDAPGVFAANLLYRGVGAINQRCVVLAGDSIIFLDRTGLYAYRSGEPVMLTVNLIDFFKDSVNQDEISRSFILHNKEEELILAFVPGADSTYPDRCIIFDLRNNFATIDLVPQVTCGYIDDVTFYLGTPYGKILKYDTSSYLDVTDTAYVTSGDADSSMAIVCDTGDFPGDGSLIGARLWLLDATTSSIWTGTIVEETETHTLTVDAWEPLFNTTDTAPVGTYAVIVGYIYFYDKSPIMTIPEDVQEKRLLEYTWTTNRVSANTVYHFWKIDVNDGGTTDVGNAWLTGHYKDIKTMSGLHRSFHLENAGLYKDAFRVKEITHHVEVMEGRKDQ